MRRENVAHVKLGTSIEDNRWSRVVRVRGRHNTRAPTVTGAHHRISCRIRVVPRRVQSSKKVKEFPVTFADLKTRFRSQKRNR